MKSARKIGTKKSRGRPATGTGLQIGARWPAEIVEEIDDWRHSQDDYVSRPEAIRRLVEIGLEGHGKPKRKLAPKASSRAADLAGEVIESRMAADATTEERETRKRRLVKGPSSFRNVRKDHPPR